MDRAWTPNCTALIPALPTQLPATAARFHRLTSENSPCGCGLSGTSAHCWKTWHWNRRASTSIHPWANTCDTTPRIIGRWILPGSGFRSLAYARCNDMRAEAFLIRGLRLWPARPRSWAAHICSQLFVLGGNQSAIRRIALQRDNLVPELILRSTRIEKDTGLFVRNTA